MPSERDRPSDSRGLAAALSGGALIGLLCGVLESIVVLGSFWYLFPTARDMRVFAVAALALDAALGALLAGILGALLGRARGWPLSVLTLIVIVAWGTLSASFPSLLLSAGRGAGLALTAALGLAAALAARPLLGRLPAPRRPRLRFAVLLMLVLVAAVLPVRLPAVEGTQPSVLLVVIDTLRADRLGFAGAPRVHTPFLDRLARRALVSTDTSTSGNLTSASLASILTSTQIATHGVQDFQGVLDRSFVTLAEEFHERGYRTFGFSSFFPASLAFHGLDQGLDYRDDTVLPRLCPACPPTDGLERLALFRALEDLGLRLLPQNLVSGTRSSDATTSAVLRFMRRDHASPFFGIVHYCDPHTPYSPKYYFSNYNKGIAGMTHGDLDDIYKTYGRTKPQVWRSPVDVKDPDFVQDSYEGEIAAVDYYFGQLMAEIRRRRAEERTIVAVTADHGESLFEHSAVSGHSRIYQSVMEVPLLIAGPGVPADRRLFEPVQSIDLYPTLCQLASIPLPPQVEGVSLLRPPVEDSAARLLIARDGFGSQKGAVRRGRYKLIRYNGDGREELFDLEADPLELHDVSHTRPEVVKALHDDLDRHLARASEPGATRNVDPQLERLKGLGYIEGDPPAR